MRHAHHLRKLEQERDQAFKQLQHYKYRLTLGTLSQDEYESITAMLLQGKTEQEYFTHLNRRIGGLREQEIHHKQRTQWVHDHKGSLLFTSILLVLAVFTLVSSPTSFTGLFTYGESHTMNLSLNITHNGTYEINLTNITSLRLSGTVYGEGTARIYVLKEGQRYLVYAKHPATNNLITGKVTFVFENDTTQEPTTTTAATTINQTETTNQTNTTATNTSNQTLTNTTLPTDNTSNQTNTTQETINQTNLTKVTNATINLSLNLTNHTPQADNQTNHTLPNTTNQTYPLNQTINQTPTNTSNHTLTNTTPEAPTSNTFTNQCVDSCILSLEEVTLEVELDNTTLELTKATYTLPSSSEISQTRPLPDLTLEPQETTVIDLTTYFTGPITGYDTKSHTDLEVSITDHHLSYTGTLPGSYTSYVYVIGEEEVLQSNTFTITVQKTSEAINQTNLTKVTNATINLSLNLTNQSLNLTNHTLNLTQPRKNQTNLSNTSFLVSPALSSAINSYGYKAHPELLNKVQRNLTVRALLKTPHGFQVVEATPDNLATLLQDGQASKLQEDLKVSLFINDTRNIIRADPASLFSLNLSLNGSGQILCYLDTGIDDTHAGITNYAYGYDVINQDDDPHDDHGHGTLVGGVLSAVAPGSTLIAVKVLDENGTGYQSDILEGLDYCAAHNATIISLSLGAGNVSGYCDADLVAEKVNSLVRQGIVVVAATGNDNSSGLPTPACAMNATRVGASTKQDTLAAFTNRNALLDLLAPGTNITTTQRGGGYTTATGTSMSAPFVAASMALLQQHQYTLPPNLTYHVRSTGKLIHNVYTHNGTVINVSRLDLFNALSNNITNTPYAYTAEQSYTYGEVFEPLVDGCNGPDCSNGETCCTVGVTCTYTGTSDSAYACTANDPDSYQEICEAYCSASGQQTPASACSSDKAGFNWTGTECCGNDAGEGQPYEVNEQSCYDGRDNDCDGDTDFADDDCNYPPETPTASIAPSGTAEDGENLLGYCDADDNETDNVSYSWVWYNESTVWRNMSDIWTFTTLTDRVACELNGTPSHPSNCSAGYATSDDYDNVSASDDLRWITEIASEDGDHDNQIFLFNLTSTQNITKMVVTWEGYGQYGSGVQKETNLSIFNWTSGSWKKLVNNNFSTATPSDATWLGNITGNGSDFINDSTSQLAVLVTTEKYAAAAGCNGWSDGTYCWYEAPNADCTDFCSDKGGVQGGDCDWTDDPTDCSTCKHWYSGANCIGASNYGPYYYVGRGSDCFYHTDGGDDCDPSTPPAMDSRFCACENSPFVYVYQNGSYTFISDFVPGADSPEKEYTHTLDLSPYAPRDKKLILKITEELRETTYLDTIYLKATNKNLQQKNTTKPDTRLIPPTTITGQAMPDIAHADNRYLEFGQGAEYILEFDLPQHYDTLELVTEGYYIEHYRKRLSELEPHNSLYTDFVELRIYRSANQSIHVDTIDASGTTPGELWNFSCQADDGQASSWDTSAATDIVAAGFCDLSGTIQINDSRSCTNEVTSINDYANTLTINGSGSLTLTNSTFQKGHVVVNGTLILNNTKRYRVNVSNTTFDVYGKLVVQNANLSLGSASKTVLKVYNNATLIINQSSMILGAPSGYNYTIIAYNGSNITILDSTLAQAGNGTSLLDRGLVLNTTIYNITRSRISNHSWGLAVLKSGVILTNISFYKNKAHLLLNKSNNTVLSNLTFAGSTQTDSLLIQDSDKVNITNNTFEGLTGYSYGDIDADALSDNFTILDNTFDNVVGSDFSLVLKGDNHIIENNSFVGTAYPLSLSGSNHLVQKNRFGVKVGTGQSIQVVNANNTRIINNSITRTGTNSPGYGLLYFSNATHTNVSGNVIEHHDNPAILIKSSFNDSSITNNTLTNATSLISIDSTATLGSVTITNNNLANATSYLWKHNAPENFNATSIWWGTTNVTYLNSKIEDGSDNAAYGNLTYCPYLLSPYPDGALSSTETGECSCLNAASFFPNGNSWFDNATYGWETSDYAHPSCCGNEFTETNLSRTCSNGCTNDTTDIACCGYADNEFYPPLNTEEILVVSFDEGSGNQTQDHSGTLANGTVNGTQQWITGKIGKAINFSGVNTSVYFADNEILQPDAITIEFWTKLNPQQVNPGDYGLPLVSKDRPGSTPAGYLVRLYNVSDTLRFQFMPRGRQSATLPQVNSTTAVSFNQWYHVAATFADGTARLYVNGQKEGELNSTTLNNGSGNPLYVGASLVLAGQRFTNGTIDQLRISTYAKSADAIERAYDDSDLLLGCHFDNSTGVNFTLPEGTIPYYNGTFASTWIMKYGSVSYYSEKEMDTYMNTDDRDALYGESTYLRLRKTASGGIKTRALLSFNLSRLTPQASILFANVTLRRGSGDDFGVGSVYAYRVLKPWAEYYVNWTVYDAILDPLEWGGPGASNTGGSENSEDGSGGDINDTNLIDSSGYANNLLLFYGSGLTDLVQQWVNGSASWGRGILLEPAFYTGGSDKDKDVYFYSRNNDNASRRPKIQVEYTLPSTHTSCTWGVESNESSLFQNASGLLGDALLFEGAGQVLRLSTKNRFNYSNGTIMFWIQPLWNGNDSNNYTLFDMDSNHTTNNNNWRRIYKDTDNKLKFVMKRWTPYNYSLNISVEDWKANEWHHIAWAWDTSITEAERPRVYIDGTLAGNLTLGSSVSQSARGPYLYIGNNRGANTTANATLDEFQIYNRKLNASEVYDRYLRAANNVYDNTCYNEGGCPSGTDLFNTPEGWKDRDGQETFCTSTLNGCSALAWTVSGENMTVFGEYGDDFEDALADPEWRFNQTNGSSGSTHTYAGGELHINASSATNMTGVANVAFLNRNMTGNWTIETNVSHRNPEAADHFAGLLVYQNDSHWLRLIKEGSVTLSAHYYNGSLHWLRQVASSGTYLRITKSDTTYNFSYSTDGSTWYEMGASPTGNDSILANFAPTRIGLFVSGNKSSMNASFSYFGYNNDETCCGDDSGESYLSRVCNADEACTTDTSDAVCCDTSTDCVYGGVCYPTGTHYNIGQYYYCNSNVWENASLSIVNATDDAHTIATGSVVNFTVGFSRNNYLDEVAILIHENNTFENCDYDTRIGCMCSVNVSTDTNGSCSYTVTSSTDINQSWYAQVCSVNNSCATNNITTVYDYADGLDHEAYRGVSTINQYPTSDFSGTELTSAEYSNISLNDANETVQHATVGCGVGDQYTIFDLRLYPGITQSFITSVSFNYTARSDGNADNTIRVHFYNYSNSSLTPLFSECSGEACTALENRTIDVTSFYQNITNNPDPLRVLMFEQEQGTGGTTPYLYTRTNNTDLFVTDFGEASRTNLWSIRHNETFLEPYPHDYILLPDQHYTSQSENTLSLRIKEVQNEITYLDLVELWIVSGNNDTEALPDYTRSGKVFTVSKHPRQPLVCVDNNENSCQNALGARDAVYWKQDEKTHTFIADFGTLTKQQAKNAKLIIKEHQYQEILGANSRSDLLIQPPIIEVQDKEGNWITTDADRITAHTPNFPNFKGARMGVLDISAYAQSPLRVRYRTQTTNSFMAVDQLALDTTPLHEPSITKLRPVETKLSPIPNYHPQGAFGYQVKGYLTSYGSATPLVNQEDESYLVMGEGDQAELTFLLPEEPSYNAQEDTLMVHSVQYFRPQDERIFIPVLPLPGKEPQCAEPENADLTHLTRTFNQRMDREHYPLVSPLINLAPLHSIYLNYVSLDVTHQAGGVFFKDSVVPTCSVTGIVSDNSNNTYMPNATAIYYKDAQTGDQTGEFNVSVTATDTGGGIHNVTFPETTSDGGADNTTPYKWNYTISTVDTFTGTANITAYDIYGNTGNCTFEVILDGGAPSGGQVGYPNTSIAVPTYVVNVSNGTDALSGLRTAQLYMRNRSLDANDECVGAYSAWSLVGNDSLGKTNVTLTGLQTDNCYYFKYAVYDNVGNVQEYTNETGELRIQRCSPEAGWTWNITDVLTCSNKEIEVAALNVTGNLTLINSNLTTGWTELEGNFTTKTNSELWQNGNFTIAGQYILIDSILHMNGTDPGAIGILVNRSTALGGSPARFRALNNANVTRGENTTFNYFFRVGERGNLTLDNAVVEHAGWNDTRNERGLELWTRNFSITNSELANNEIGLSLYVNHSMIVGNTIRDNSRGVGFYTNATNNTLRDGIVENNTLGDVTSNATNTDNRLRNMTFGTIDSCVTCNVTVQWYLDVLVNTTDGPSNGAAINITGQGGIAQQDYTTDATGFVRKINLSAYTQYGSSNVTYSNYTINATFATYPVMSKQRNHTGNIQLNFTVQTYPEITDPFIKPDYPTAVDDLHCNATVTDNEQSPLNLTFVWLNWTGAAWENVTNETFEVSNGTTVEYNLSSSYTQNDDQWNCTVYANDNYNLSGNKSVTVLIGNQPPDTPVVTINSSDGTNATGQDLNCVAQLTDYEGDALNATVNWSRNGVWNRSDAYTHGGNSYANGTWLNATLGFGNTSVGDNWSCSIQVDDGTTMGGWGNSSNLTIVNLIPVATATIMPASPYTNDTLIGNCSATDADGDNVSYYWEWYNGTTLFNASNTSANFSQGTSINVFNISSINTSKGETWNLSCRAKDAYNYSAWTSTTKTIQDSPPDTPAVTINSSDGTNRTNQDLNCVFQLTDNDGDELTASVNWSRNGVWNRSDEYNNSEAGYTNGTWLNATLGFGNTSIGDNWSCEARVHDGTSYGLWANSSNLTIINSLPNITTPVVIPADPNDYADLNCSVFINDSDHTTLNVSFTWWNDSSQVTAYDTTIVNAANGTTVYTNVTVPETATARGENWKCMARAYDGYNYSVWLNSTPVTIAGCGEVYQDLTLDANATSEGTCFIIKANDVTLDCAGYNVTYSTGDDTYRFGVNNSGYNRTTIKNCRFIEGNTGTEGSYAIAVYNDVEHNTIVNNTILVEGSHSYGIHLYNDANHNWVANNTINITTESGYRYPIRLYNITNNNTITNNTIHSGGYGMSLYNKVYNTTITDNTITTTDSGANGIGIRFTTACQNNTVARNTIRATYASLYLSGSGEDVFNNIFESNTLLNHSVTSVYSGGGAYNNILRNTTYNRSTLAWGNEVNNLTIQWYVRVNVSDESGSPVEAATVNISDNTPLSQFTENTDASGLTSHATLTDEIFRVGSGSNTTLNNHTVNVNKSSFVPVSESHNISSSRTINITFNLNTLPNTTTPEIIPSNPNTTSELNCSVNVTDAEQTVLNVSFTWWNDSIQVTAYDTTIVNAANDSTVYTNLTVPGSATQRGENWTCMVRAYDGINYSNWTNSTEVTIDNLPPTVPTLLSPSNDNNTVHNRNVTFRWESSDPDGDGIVYEINVTANGACDLSQGFYVDNISEKNFTNNSVELCTRDEFLSTDLAQYNWTVRACDDSGYANNCSDWAAIWNFSLEPWVVINFVNPEMDFGTLSLLDINDTLDDDPPPFKMENLGNVRTSLVNVSAEGSLWVTADMGTKYLQMKVTNRTQPGSIVNLTNTSTEWFNLSNTTNHTIINELNYSSTNRTADVEVRVEVPPSEPPGEKTLDLVFYWEQSPRNRTVTP